MKSEDQYWAGVLEQNMQDFTHEEEKKQQKIVDKKQTIKNELGKQVFAKKQLLQQEAKQDWDYHLMQQGLLKNEQDKNLIKRNVYQQKLKDEGTMRKQMIELAHQRKQNQIMAERMLDIENRRKAEEERVKEAEREKKKLENYKSSCRKQLEENKQMRDVFQAKEFEEENKPPQGNDLMQVIYNVKPHQAYARRQKNDQQQAMIFEKLDKDPSKNKVYKELQSINEYVQHKEVTDRRKDDQKLKKLKNLEMEMKRTLDQQVQEKGVAKKLRNFSEGLETNQIKQDYIEYQRQEVSQQLKQEKKVKSNQLLLN